jgi:ribonucleoside-diphosphate reductase beta chain
MCTEYPELHEDVKSDVLRAAELMVEMEHKFIDMIFEQGDLENLKANDLKQFILKRANEKIAELGYTKGPFMEYDEDAAGELDWFYHLTGGTTHTDFFAVRPTDYSKAGEDENWDEDELF